jgi:hypothetical protein
MHSTTAMSSNAFVETKLYDGNNKTQKALKKCKNGKAQHCKNIAFNF